MFQFAKPAFLWLLLLVPILALFMWLHNRWRSSSIKKLGNPKLVNRLMPAYSHKRKLIAWALLLSSLFLLCFGLANPQFGTKLEKVQQEGIDIMVALDVSNSMKAEDVQPDRITRAKQLISRLIDNLNGDRIGFIVFAGDAYMQMPLTNDYGTAKMLLQSMTPETVPIQGTAIGAAVDVAANLVSDTLQRDKPLLLISDGEDHEQNESDIIDIAKAANIKIFSVGVGTVEGGNIPVVLRGRRDIKRDRQGNVVTTALQPTMLKNLARATGGSYFHLQGALNETDNILAALNRLNKGQFDQYEYVEFADRFQWFIAAALLLLLIYYFGFANRLSYNTTTKNT